MIFQPEIVRALWQYTALALPAQLPAGHFIAWGDGIGTNTHEDYYEDFGTLPEPFFYLERGRSSLNNCWKESDSAPILK